MGDWPTDAESDFWARQRDCMDFCTGMEWDEGVTLGDIIEVLNNVLDDEPCRLDHHGYCQTHDWPDASPCPNKRGNTLLSRIRTTTEKE